MFKVAVYSTNLERLDEGVNVAVLVFAVVLSVLSTVPDTALPELSTKVKVLVVMVELSINSEKMAEIVETTVVAPSVGEVEETVGAVVSTVNEVKVMVFPVFPARSVTVTVQSE